jgi:hypothetical protein
MDECIADILITYCCGEYDNMITTTMKYPFKTFSFEMYP